MSAPDVELGEVDFAQVSRPRFTSSQGPSVYLSFQNVGYSVPLIARGKMPWSRKPLLDGAGQVQQKHILQDVTGYVAPGQLVCIMGASGAGKTSLLNILAGKNSSFSGRVLINGKPISKASRRVTAFCQQEDLFFGSLTVREHLYYQARLRMPRGTPEHRVQARVEELIRDLGLLKCAHTRIGNQVVKGISGGEKKRLAFASEIVNDPSLLFADEPTSGLDSFMALSVVKTLKAMTMANKTVIATLHQPSSEVYQLVDRVILLAEGRIAYCGSRDGAIPYFAKHGCPCPMYMNPADYFIYRLAVLPNHEAESRKRIAYLCDEYTGSEHARLMEEGAGLPLKAGAAFDPDEAGEKMEAKEASLMRIEAAAQAAREAKDGAEGGGAEARDGVAAEEAASVAEASSSVAAKESDPNADAEPDAAPEDVHVDAAGSDGKEEPVAAPALKGDPPRTRARAPLTPTRSASRIEDIKHHYNTPWWMQFRLLIARAFLSVVRDPVLTKARLGQSIVLGVIAGLLYLDTEMNQQGVQNINGALFFILINQSFSGVFGVLQSFPLEIPVFKREREASLYSTSSYYAAKTLADLPFQVVFTVIFCVIVYWFVGFHNTFEAFIVFVGTVVLCANTAYSLGYVVSCVTPSVQVALAVAPLALLPQLLLGGWFVNTDTVPVYFEWVKAISVFHYGFEILGVNQWRNIDSIACDASSSERCLSNGDAVLDTFNMDKDDVGLDVALLFVLLISFRVLAYVALAWRTRNIATQS